MPLFRVISTRKEGTADSSLAARRRDHLLWQFEGEAEGILFGAGAVYAPDGKPPPREGMYILVCADEAEARARADADPYHTSGLREYTLMRWSLNESSYLGVGLRAALNGDDPSEPKYRPPK